MNPYQVVQEYGSRYFRAIPPIKVECLVCDRIFMSKDAPVHVAGRAHQQGLANLSEDESEDDYEYMPPSHRRALDLASEYSGILRVSHNYAYNVYCLLCNREMSAGSAMSHMNGAAHQQMLDQLPSSSEDESEDESEDDYEYMPPSHRRALDLASEYSGILRVSHNYAYNVYCLICDREMPAGSAMSHMNGAAHQQMLDQLPSSSEDESEDEYINPQVQSVLSEYGEDEVRRSNNGDICVHCVICNRHMDAHTFRSHAAGTQHRWALESAATKALQEIVCRYGDYFSLGDTHSARSIICTVCSSTRMSRDSMVAHCSTSWHDASVRAENERRRALEAKRVEEAERRAKRAAFHHKHSRGRRYGGHGKKPDSDAIASFLSQVEVPLPQYNLISPFEDLCALKEFPTRDEQVVARQDLDIFAKASLYATSGGAEFRKLVDQRMPLEVLFPYPRTCDPIRELLALALHVEEASGLLELRAYNKTNIALKPHAFSARMFEVDMPGVSENRPSILRGDILLIHRDNDPHRPDTLSTTFYAFVHFVNADTIVFSLPDAFEYSPLYRYSIVFKLNRGQERKLHRAVQNIPREAMLLKANTSGLHCNYSPRLDPWGGHGATATLQKLNEEQRAFVRHVHGRARLSVLWGPPGTGKTTTLVAAIADTAVRDPKARILVCTPSNEAADLIAERLAVNGNTFMLRLPSLTRDPKLTPSSIARFYPQLSGSSYLFPSKAKLKEYTIIICTLMTCDRLYSCGVARDHFTHLFVDEAGHASEQLLMIGLNTASSSRAKVVLAGDHKQLGPRTTVPVLMETGLARSPLLRIHSDPSFWAIVGNQLLRCYRSHPAIVKLINACYDDRLLATVGDTNTFAPFWRQSSLLRGWWSAHRQQSWRTFLSFNPPCPKEPILFLEHTHPESREADSPSWMNAFEIRTAVNLAFELFALGLVRSFSDIAIITPYRKQAQKLRESIYGRMFNDSQLSQHMIQRDPRTQQLLNRPQIPMQVATVDSFQGREARVVIVTCVRSRVNAGVQDAKFGLGFLSQPERANVALSRAKDFLVIIGNRKVLSTDPTWRSYFDRIAEMDEGVVLNLGGPADTNVVDGAARGTNTAEEAVEERGGVAREE